MKCSQEEIIFKINSIKVKESTSQLLRQQVQYYFSSINLITDTFLRNIIACSFGGWVQIKIILHFQKINHIFNNSFDTSLSFKQKRAILRHSCQNSLTLQVNKQNVRARGINDLKNAFQSCVYIEGPENEEQIRQKCIKAGISPEQLRIRKDTDNQWFLLSYSKGTSSDLLNLLNRESFNQNTKIIHGQEFINIQDKYNQLLGIKKMQENITQSDIKYKIPSGRIISYRQLQILKTNPKPRKLQNSKTKRSRIPKHFLTKKQKRKDKQCLQLNKLQLEYNQNSKPKKTKEEIHQYQKTKIIQKKELKKLKQMSKYHQKYEKNEDVGEKMVIQ